ncbi:MAG: hypothetical protein ABH834_06855 [Candidatus Altiarchaeota archaeon]
MSVYKSNGGKEITSPKVGVSDAAYAQLGPDNRINEVWGQLNSKAINVAQASARVMDDVVPAWAVSDKPCQNFECACDIIVAGPQDEFTQAVGRLIQEHPEPGQEELRGSLRPLVLERSVFHVFWTGVQACEQLSLAYSSVDADLAAGKPFAETALAKFPGTAGVAELTRRREQFTGLSRIWGGGMEQRLSAKGMPVGDAMYSWVECLNEDVLHERALDYSFIKIAESASSGKPLDDFPREFLPGSIESSPKELCAVGLILARGNVMDKWDYFDPEAKSNYPRAIERLNGGADIELPQVCDIVRAKYPRASSSYPPLPDHMGDK